MPEEAAGRGINASAEGYSEWKTPSQTQGGQKDAHVRERENCGQKANNTMMEILNSASREAWFSNHCEGVEPAQTASAI